MTYSTIFYRPATFQHPERVRIFYAVPVLHAIYSIPIQIWTGKEYQSFVEIYKLKKEKEDNYYVYEFAEYRELQPELP